MGLLDGKKALIFGVANDHSIAWGIAKALHDQGATVGFASIESLIERRVRPLATSIGSTFVEACDVSSDDQLRDVMAKWSAAYGGIDVLVHAVAFAPREDLEGSFTATTRSGFAVAMDVSAYSLVAMCREAVRAGLFHEGSSVLTLSYYGAEKVVANYNVMGVAKAALEASTRYLASDLGPQNIRVNTVSAGPLNTLAARGVGNMNVMLRHHADRAPLRRNVEAREVGNAALFLLSPLSSGITGEVLHVDCGFNIMAF